MSKKKQLQIAMKVCANTWDISEANLKEIISNENKVMANIGIKHTFRAVMAILSDHFKELGIHRYTLEEIAALENRFGESAHSNVIASKMLFNERLSGKVEDGYTRTCKLANYFLKDEIKKEK